MCITVYNLCVWRGEKPEKGRLARLQTDWVDLRDWEHAASRSVEKGGAVEVEALKGRRDDGVGGECGWDNCRMREEMGK